MTIHKETIEAKRQRGVYVGVLLRALSDLKISKYKISQQTGIRWNTLWTWMTGKAQPSQKLLEKIEKFYQKESKREERRKKRALKQ